MSNIWFTCLDLFDSGTGKKFLYIEHNHFEDLMIYKNGIIFWECLDS